jgi:hypothetical protein
MAHFTSLEHFFIHLVSGILISGLNTGVFLVGHGESVHRRVPFQRQAVELPRN